MSDQEFNKIFSKRLKHYLNEYDMTQADLARLLCVSTQSVTNWCKGAKSPRMDKVDTMCRIFNCKRSDFMEEKNIDVGNCSSSAVVIPVLGRVAAGIPLTASEYIVDTEEIPAAMASDGEYFGLVIKGDSMEPKISNGDVVIVRKQEDADDGDIVIALVNGDDAVCKRLKKYNDGISLISNNPAYEPMYFNNTEIAEKPVQIIGKVKELRAKF